MESEGDIMNDSSPSSPDMLPLPQRADNRTRRRAPRRPSKVIPDRIFVHGFDSLVKDSDLHDFFSQYGRVKDANVVTNCSGVSKGYGFVTFENQEDATKLLQDDNDISFRDKKLTIDQAFLKQLSRNGRGPGFAAPSPVFWQNSVADCPYVCHSGRPNLYCPGVNYCPHQWPSCCLPQHHQQTSLSLLLPQSYRPPYQTPACQLHQMPFDPVVYAEPSEYFYQPTGGDPEPPVHTVMENTPEECVEPSVATGSSTAEN